jgi:hypothetical protein
MDERRRTLPSIASLFYTCKQSNWRSFPDVTWNQMEHRFQTRSGTRGMENIKATFPQSYWFLHIRNNFESPSSTAPSVSHFHVLKKHAEIYNFPNSSSQRNELKLELYNITKTRWHPNYWQGGKSGNAFFRVVLDLSLGANTGNPHWDYSRIL